MTEKKRKSLLYNPDRIEARKKLKRRMKQAKASEVKKAMPTSLDEVLK